jgi:hypothetical protein
LGFMLQKEIKTKSISKHRLISTFDLIDR